jgi:hypothetical protein
VKQKFRTSEYIDFNTGTVKLAPIQLQFRMRMAGEVSFADLVRLFQCRVEVWHLGVATQIVHEIEFGSPPAVWSHAAYGLLSLVIPYFEMVGKIVNPAALPPSASQANTLVEDFDCGFRDVYTDLTTSSGTSYDPLKFYNLARSGLYALGATQQGLWMHNERTISTKDFDIIQKNPNDPSTLKHYVNPHAVVRTVVDHFPTVVARLNDPASQNEEMRARFRHFFVNGSEL